MCDIKDIYITPPPPFGAPRLNHFCVIIRPLWPLWPVCEYQTIIVDIVHVFLGTIRKNSLARAVCMLLQGSDPPRYIWELLNIGYNQYD